MPSPWERNRRVILAAFALEAVSYKLVFPFIPLYVQTLEAIQPTLLPLWSGAITGVGALAVAVTLPLWNRMARRTGRKFQVLRALGGCILGLVAAVLARSALQLFLAYMLEGLTSGFYPQMWILVSTGAPAGSVGEAVGLLQGLDMLVNAVAPTLGGLMADAVGYRAGYLLGIGLCVAALAVMWRGYREDEGERPAEEAGAGISLREAPSVPGLLSLLALAFLVAALIPGLGPLLPIQLQRLAGEGAPVATLSGAALALGNVAASGAALSLGRASRRWPSGRLLAASFVAGGAATALVPAIPAVGAAFGLWVARSGLTGAVVPLLYGAADVHLPPRAREAVYPSLTAAMMVGYAAGPLFAGLLGLVDLGGAFVAVGVMLMGLGLWAARAFAPESRLA